MNKVYYKQSPIFKVLNNKVHPSLKMLFKIIATIYNLAKWHSNMLFAQLDPVIDIKPSKFLHESTSFQSDNQTERKKDQRYQRQYLFPLVMFIFAHTYGNIGFEYLYHGSLEWS